MTGRPVLGPLRCVCDAPREPFIHVDAGVFGTVACGDCARLLMSYHPQQLTTVDRLVQQRHQHALLLESVKQRLHAAILGVIG